MSHFTIVLCAALLLLMCVAGTGAADKGNGLDKVGVRELHFVDAARQRPLAVHIWYPAAASAVQAQIVYARIYQGFAAVDALYLEQPQSRPLILLSHGDRGSNTDQSWLAEALAGNGYVVAAVAHWHNTTTDNVPEETVRVWNRPQDVSYVLSALLNDPQWGKRIDAQRIAVAGHSSGGYTALALVGARYDRARMLAYCAGPGRGPDCDLAKGADLQAIDFSDSGKLYRDDRIKAALAMAPALGQGIDPQSLPQISRPVHIFYAKDDELLKPALNALHYASGVPHAGVTAFDRGGHFVFLPRCTTLGRVISYSIAFDICGRKTSADRAATHQQISREALDFFAKTLN